MNNTLMALLQTILFRRLIGLFFLCFPLFLSGQTLYGKRNSGSGYWKFDFKTGVGTFLTGVPEKYLSAFNNVNIPAQIPGITTSLIVRKSWSPHLEVGFQLNYMTARGEVKRLTQNFQVETQTLESDFLILYNLVRTDQPKSRLNGLLYSKLGNVSIRNDAYLMLPDGSASPEREKTPSNPFIRNLSLVMGLGVGINYQVLPNLSILTTYDLNRNFELSNEFFKFRKNFSHAANAITNYTHLSFGITYTYGASKNKQSRFSIASNNNKRFSSRSTTSGANPVKISTDYFYFVKHRKASYYHSKKKSKRPTQPIKHKRKKSKRY